MRRTGDQFLVKEINLSIVLDTILRHEPVSRAGISALTGLNKGTVSSLVQELIDRGLVSETGTGESSGGRKPVLLQFQKDAGYAIGIDLGVNYTHAVRTDLNGLIIEQTTIQHQNESEEGIYRQLTAAIDSIIRSVPSSPYGVVGIGLGIPGIVDSSGRILFAPNLGWRNSDLTEKLHEQYGLPIHIDNEANAGAIGEQQYGAGKGTSDLVFISAGIGIGSGIILNNNIYKGSSGFSGEIGHLTIDANGKQCRCGNRGCWELYASENALLANVNRLPELADRKEPLTLEHVIALAEDRHPIILEAIESVGRYLGIGIAGIINTFNPKRIIIGNRLTKVSEWMSEPLLQEVESRALPFHRQAVEVQFSQLNAHSTALGASYIAISSFLRDVTAASRN